jgi:hypothetical protein
MREFIFNLLKFSAVFIISIMLLIIGGTFLTGQTKNFNIAHNKTILVIGDSHTACAINDSLLINAYNFSSHGTGYFYSYLKTREILTHNPQINTVVLGYSFLDLDNHKDSWFSGSDKIMEKMPRYFFMFNLNDLHSLFISNPFAVFQNIPKIIRSEIILLFYNLELFGGYSYLDRDKVEEAKYRFRSSKKRENEAKYSKYQEKYLLKIYKMVTDKNIDLILLNVPLHPLLNNELEKNKKYYYSFAQQKLPKAKIINHSNKFIPEYGFSDLDHLNYKGAKLYSEYLTRNGFSQSPFRE